MLLRDMIYKKNQVMESLAIKESVFMDQTKPFKDKIFDLNNQIFALKETIQDEALETFAVTGEKKMFGGIGIQVRTNIEYDKGLAFDWSKEHNLCLKLDDSAFKKLAKTNAIDFVSVTEKTVVTFPAQIKWIDNDLK